MFLRLLIYIILGVVIYRAIKRWSAPSGRTTMNRTDRTPLRADDVMIQDPLCGIYFAKRDGVTLNDQGQELYFCSDACRTKYLDQQRHDD